MPGKVPICPDTYNVLPLLTASEKGKEELPVDGIGKYSGRLVVSTDSGRLTPVISSAGGAACVAEASAPQVSAINRAPARGLLER